MRTGIEMIVEERKRQIEEEGWTIEHDDSLNSDGELGNAAACYAMTEEIRDEQTFDDRILNCVWPWGKGLFKPTPDNRIRELVKAGALIVAEIERLQRKEENYE